MSTVLVTGGTAGIGLSFARQLAERGHDVVLVARNRERLDQVATQLRQTYAVATEVVVADLSDADDLARVAARVADRERPIDLLVNNAGYGLGGSFLKNDVALEITALDVLVKAVMVLSHQAGAAMRERGHGAIVNVSSVGGFAPMGPYSAAKAYVTTFSEGLAAELAGSGVTVTALCPGFTHTEFHERAELDMAWLPDAMWLDADAVVRTCLADVARGRPVSVPGAQYRAIVAGIGLAPRALVRYAVGGNRRTLRRR